MYFFFLFHQIFLFFLSPGFVKLRKSFPTLGILNEGSILAFKSLKVRLLHILQNEMPFAHGAAGRFCSSRALCTVILLRISATLDLIDTSNFQPHTPSSMQATVSYRSQQDYIDSF